MEALKLSEQLCGGHNMLENNWGSLTEDIRQEEYQGRS
jgi:hypothetical protein